MSNFLLDCFYMIRILLFLCCPLTQSLSMPHIIYNDIRIQELCSLAFIGVLWNLVIGYAARRNLCYSVSFQSSQAGKGMRPSHIIASFIRYINFMFNSKFTCNGNNACCTKDPTVISTRCDTLCEITWELHALQCLENTCD